MRVVLDTNVFVSALITKGTPPDLLYRAWERGSFDVVTSTFQLAELVRVLDYVRLRPFIAREEATALLGTLGSVAIVLDSLPEMQLSPDPDDNAILATAVGGGAELLVTGDKSHLLDLKTVRGIAIVTAREALGRIGRQD